MQVDRKNIPKMSKRTEMYKTTSITQLHQNGAQPSV